MMSTFAMTEASSKSSAILSTAILLIVGYIAAYLVNGRKKAFTDLARLGKKDDSDFTRTLLDGYRKYRDAPWILPLKPNYLILPARYIDEVKSLPNSKFSFDDEMYLRFAGRYSTLGVLTAPELIHSIRSDLTRSIGRVLEELQKESDFAITENIGACDEWTQVPLHMKMLRIVAHLSGRVFVGHPLCRNEEWIQATINYTVAAFGVQVAVLKYPKLIRPFIAPFLPQVKTVHRQFTTAERLLKPIIEERLAAMKEDTDAVLPEDAIQFLIRNSGGKADDIAYSAKLQMFLSLAAIHTTTMTLTHTIYDLCAHPEVVEPLREELKSVLDSDDGILVKQSMTKLKKMDSFMKESQRFNGTAALTLRRMTNETFQLSDGLEIPRGQSIAFNTYGTNMDPSIYPNPEKFDAFRFSDLRELPGNETRFQFVATTLDSLNFGHGVHACPGRFFASNEVKVALSYILQNYDFKFKDGEKRPVNVCSNFTIVPDPSVGIVFKRRKAA